MKVHPSAAKKPFPTPHGPKSSPRRSGDKAWFSPPYLTSLFNLIVFSTHLFVHIFMLFSAAWLAVFLVMTNLPAQALSAETYPIIPVVWHQPPLPLYPMLLFSWPILQFLNTRSHRFWAGGPWAVWKLPSTQKTGHLLFTSAKDNSVWGHTDKAQGSADDHRELTCSVFTCP